ncbi:MAG: IPT/TIG domain-containing protein [Planctomycetota bacterium]
MHESTLGARAFMTSSLFLSLLLAALGWPATTRGQDQYFVVDSTTDEIYRLLDADQNGTIDPLTEVQLFYGDISPGPDLSVPNHLLSVGTRLLVADTGTIDAVLSLADLNGDGDANDDGEVISFYDDSSPGIDLSSPNGLSLAPDGSVFVADDGATVLAVLRLSDSNNDGDANDDGEVTVFYDATGAGPQVADPESVAVSAAGIVYVGDTATGRIVRMVDLNGDFDALDAGEATIFFEGNTPMALEDLDSLQVDGAEGVYAIDENTGIVLYLRDLDGDGNALDPLEATVFFAGSGSGATDLNDGIVVGPGELILLDGGLDSVLRVADLDASGAITPSEIVTIYDDMGGPLSTPSGVAFVPATMPPRPLLISVNPSSGPLVGGTTVTLAGNALSATSSVRFGGVDAASFNGIDDTLITAVTPPGLQPGAVDITVTTPGGSSGLLGAFEYLAPTGLMLTGIDPAVSATSGGALATAFGFGWDPTAPLAVLFDTETATVMSATADRIVVFVPAHSPGLVDVSVVQGGQQSTLPAAFRYQVSFVRGDSDGNGLAGLGDAVTLLNYLFVTGTPEPSCLDALDVNDDGLLGVDDALHLLQYLFTNGPAPSTPYPDSGLDPTPSTPGCAG